jgi:protein gp37
MDNDCHVLPGKTKIFGSVMLYPYGFAPMLHTYRLADPQKIKKPQTIFVCSMADLFGNWVLDEWIESVFYACEEAPQHRYLFLTKNPHRLTDFMQSNEHFFRNENWYFGTTVTKQIENSSIGSLLGRFKLFVSIEPIIQPMILSLEYVKWAIIGAETGNRKGKIIPEKSWIDDIVTECRQQSIPVFMKESLRELMGPDFIQTYPWEAKGHDPHN